LSCFVRHISYVEGYIDWSSYHQRSVGHV
jgi:hypothetical protein